jgi:hypothetical protein
MSITKDLTVTVTNDSEGITTTFKTVSVLGATKVSISGDPGVFNIKELQDALNAVTEFNTISIVTNQSPEGQDITLEFHSSPLKSSSAHKDLIIAEFNDHVGSN